MSIQIENKAYEMLKPLFSIPSTVDKAILKTILDEYATRNNFVLTVSKSNAMSLTFQCKKGDVFKITRKNSSELKKKKKLDKVSKQIALTR